MTDKTDVREHTFSCVAWKTQGSCTPARNLECSWTRAAVALSFPHLGALVLSCWRARKRLVIDKFEEYERSIMTSFLPTLNKLLKINLLWGSSNF